MISYIGVIHVRPETDGLGEILPHTLIFPYRFLTLSDKGIQSVFLDLFFSVKPEKFLYLKLHRQSMGIPSGFSGNHISLHGAISRNHILNYPGKHMTDMGLPVCGGRAVIKCIDRASFPDLHAFLKNVVLLPEFCRLFFTIHKIQVR